MVFGGQKRDTAEIVKRWDFSGTGCIEYSEYLIATMDKEKLLSRKNLKALFDAFDKNTSGYITIDDIRSRIRAKSIQESIWKEFTAEANLKSGIIVDFEDFSDFITKAIREPSSPSKWIN